MRQHNAHPGEDCFDLCGGCEDEQLLKLAERRGYELAIEDAAKEFEKDADVERAQLEKAQSYGNTGEILTWTMLLRRTESLISRIRALAEGKR